MKFKVTIIFQIFFFFAICFIESPLKVMKNAFYFILKAFFVLRILKFLSQLFRHQRKMASL